METSSSRKPGPAEFGSCVPLTVRPNHLRMRSSQALSTGRSGSPSFQAATILNGSTSPTPIASFAFPMQWATSSQPADPRPSRTCHTATATQPETSCSATTTSGCWSRLAPPAMMVRAWEARPEDCRLGSTDIRSARAGEARLSGPTCWRSTLTGKTRACSPPASAIA